MSDDWWLAVAGTLALILGMLSRRLRDLPVSGPLVALVTGAILGPSALGVLDVADDRQVSVLRESARLSVSVAVMAVALRHTLTDLRREIRALSVLLGLVLPAMGATCGVLAAAVLGLPAAPAALLGATLAATDPVLAANVVTGHRAERLVPDRVRVLVATEAAANDGLASVLVLGAAGAVAGSVVGETAVALAELAAAVVTGAVIGLAAGRLLAYAARHRDIEHAAFLVITVTLTLTVLGIAELVGAQEVIAVFVAGLAFDTQISSDDRREEWQVQEAVHEYLVLPVFVLLGVLLPWSSWADLGWKAPAFVVAVLLVRRLPWVLAAQTVLRLPIRSTVFVGWFGPIGVAALLYVSHMREAGHLGEGAFAVGLMAVAASTVVHGVTGLPGTSLVAGRRR